MENFEIYQNLDEGFNEIDSNNSGIQSIGLTGQINENGDRLKLLALRGIIENFESTAAIDKNTNESDICRNALDQMRRDLEWAVRDKKTKKQYLTE